MSNSSHNHRPTAAAPDTPPRHPMSILSLNSPSPYRTPGAIPTYYWPEAIGSPLAGPLSGGRLAAALSHGQTLDAFAQDMKRALDLSSLPVNPLTGAAPLIDPSAASTSQTNGDSFTAKRPRNLPHIPLNSGFHLESHYAPQAPSPSPLTPLLAMPLSPQATPTAGPPGSARNGHPISVPSTPMMGMGFPYYQGMPYPMTSPIISPSMNTNVMTGNYGPAAAAAAAAAAGNTTGRTVYVGNLPSDASVDELLNLVRFGPIEQIRLIPDKSCVFISFLDGSTAAGFHADALVKKLALLGQELRIGWGKPSMVSKEVLQAVQTSQATRNVFVGNLKDETTEQDLRDELSKFGPIDQVKIVRDKNIGFIHFLSIQTAMKVVAQLPLEKGWEDKRVNYGKDRCAYVPKAQQAAVQAAQSQALAAVHAHAQIPSSPFAPFTPMSPAFSSFGTPTSPNFASPIIPNGFPTMAGAWGDQSQMGNRTIYLGNIPSETSTEELCNNIRGGMLERIKHIPEKGIAFVSFVDSDAAAAFYQYANSAGITLNSRRLKVGWGTKSGPMPTALLTAVKGGGATRNVYVGSISDWETFTDAKLRKDFAEYGEIEMINFLKEKGAAFVNFTSIQSAQKAIEQIKAKPEYSVLRVAYGKDRCANAPRPPGTRPQTMRTPSGNHTAEVDTGIAVKEEEVEDDVIAYE